MKKFTKVIMVQRTHFPEKIESREGLCPQTGSDYEVHRELLEEENRKYLEDLLELAAGEDEKDEEHDS